jgi:hypothetical protein
MMIFSRSVECAVAAVLSTAIPAHVAGMMAYGTAGVACLIAALSARQNDRLRRLAGALFLLEAALFSDMRFNWRWALHDWLENRFAAHHLYDQRRGVQVAALAALMVAVLLLLQRIFRKLRSHPWQAAAVSGAALSLGLWSVEVISLHQIDGLLYTRIGPLIAVAYLWILPCLLTATGMLMAAFSG